MFGKKRKPDPEIGPLLRPVKTFCASCNKSTYWLLEVPKVCPTCQSAFVPQQQTK